MWIFFLQNSKVFYGRKDGIFFTLILHTICRVKRSITLQKIYRLLVSGLLKAEMSFIIVTFDVSAYAVGLLIHVHSNRLRREREEGEI